MKLRKVLAIVMAVAMVAALAMSASASPIISRSINSTADGEWAFQTHVAGSGVNPPLTGVEPHIIRAVRFTFTNITTITCPDTGDQVATATVAVNGNGDATPGSPTREWVQEDLDLTQTTSYTFQMQADVSWLQVSAASWVGDGFSANVRVELLGPDGQVLADGATEDSISGGGGTTATTRRASGTTTRRTDATGAPKTGVTGIAVVGAVAILAAGAIVVSRRRSK